MSEEIAKKVIDMYKEADDRVEYTVTCYVDSSSRYISLGHLNDLQTALKKIPGFKFSIQCQIEC